MSIEGLGKVDSIMKVVSLAVSRKKGTRKEPVDQVRVIGNFGIEGDAHAGDWHRQVSLLASESIDSCRRSGLDVTFGDFAENIATTGIDWKTIPVGTRVKVGGEVLLEITQIGKECVRKCAIFYQAGDCIMPKEGVFARVLEGGAIRCGDKIEFHPGCESIESRPVLFWTEKEAVSELKDLIQEEPLSIRIEGKPYSVVMRTPGDEIPHAAGFCLGEGIIDTPDDIAAIGFCDGSDSNVVTVTLKESRREKVSGILDRRGYISQTSCGLCGKEIVDELYQTIRPLTDETRIDIRKGLDCLRKLSMQQPLRERTRAAHAASVYSSDFRLLSTAEDVGRHNALDKVIGKLLLDKKLGESALLILSSRISYELVQKAARARIPVLMAMSRPTSLAVALASELNMTLACHAKEEGLYIFCGRERFVEREVGSRKSEV